MSVWCSVSASKNASRTSLRVARLYCELDIQNGHRNQLIAVHAAFLVFAGHVREEKFPAFCNPKASFFKRWDKSRSSLPGKLTVGTLTDYLHLISYPLS